MRFAEARDIILQQGSETQMVRLFDLTDQLGGSVRVELVFMAAYTVAGFRGYLRQCPGAFYLLSDKGVAAKAALSAHVGTRSP